MRHSRASRSISPELAPLASPDRHAVSTTTTEARRTDRPAVARRQDGQLDRVDGEIRVAVFGDRRVDPIGREDVLRVLNRSGRRARSRGQGPGARPRRLVEVSGARLRGLQRGRRGHPGSAAEDGGCHGSTPDASTTEGSRTVSTPSRRRRRPVRLERSCSGLLRLKPNTRTKFYNFQLLREFTAKLYPTL